MRYLIVADAPSLGWSAYGSTGLWLQKHLVRDGHEAIIYGAGAVATASESEYGVVVGDLPSHNFQQCIVAHANNLDVDCVILLKDPYYFSAHDFVYLHKPLVMFANVHTSEVNPGILQGVHSATTIFSPSAHAVASFAKHGIEAHYTPHGIDFVQFAPMPKDQARDKLDWRQDAFIALFVGINNGYPSRKNIDRIIESWFAFVSVNGSASSAPYLHMHTGKLDQGGVNLHNLCAALGLAYPYIGFVNDYEFAASRYDIEYMRTLYSAADVLLAIGNEGFCLPVVEAQACGTPVLGIKFAGLQDTIKTGIAIEANEPHTGVGRFIPSGGFEFVPHASVVAQGLKVMQEQLAVGKFTKARESVTEYESEHVWRTHWRPALESVTKLIEDADLYA